MDDIRWADRPPDQSRLPHLPLMAARPGRPIRGIITSTRLRGVYTHFLGSRTQPCMKLNCPGCEKKLPSRWEGYVSLWTAAPSKHIIARLTEAAANEIAENAPDYQNLRGLTINLERASTRANSRLLAKVEVLENNQVRLPAEPDLIAHLVLIWRMSGQTAEFDPTIFTQTREELISNFNGRPHA